MEVLVYLLLFILNIIIMVTVIRWRGFSFEGLGLTLLLLIIVSDLIGLTIELVTSPVTRGAMQEFTDRLYPTLVHILAMIVLALGLWIADPKPRRVSRELSAVERSQLSTFATVLAVLGVAMKLLALYSGGVTSLSQYFSELGQYRTAQGKFGGFLDQGTQIAVLALAILANTVDRKSFRQWFLVGTMVALSFVLSFSKSDLIGTLVMFFFATGVLNPQRFKDFTRYRWRMILLTPLVMGLLLLNSGIKAQLRGSTEGALDLSRQALSSWSAGVFVDRFGQGGLFDGFVNLVNRLEEGEAQFFNGRVAQYAVTAWIPYVIYRDKPPHPFKAVGYLMYDDRHTIETEVSASTLVGSAFADFGLVGVVAYLLLYGLALGAIRKWTVRRGAGIYGLIWYLHFTVVDGATNMVHGGIVNFFDALALASGAMALSYFGVLITSVFARPDRKERPVVNTPMAGG